MFKTLRIHLANVMLVTLLSLSVVTIVLPNAPSFSQVVQADECDNATCG